MPSNSPVPTQISVAPNRITPTQPQAKPVLISELPREGFAIRTNAPEVINSEREIAKLRSSLPFIRDLTGVNRRKISIVIPEAEYQDDPWKLTVQIFGPDYQISSTSSNYQIEKALFIQGANTVFSWIRENGADSNKIIIKWGDQAFIQQRAEQWIAE